ncbi:Z1 domain-containing protein [Halobacillus yeomjeoni]|uniref:Z1 domain-containing protein n=1 Tax=Halobacillus yeomjeoni TaxID=311194 RepID=A0A931HXR9_9BACI|nr:Z1 domain-containing protein [Halobacillus yeomjeoni]MBH0231379.1 Z1 domain-containing protein [Halobacillus yeomjeoni]
MNEIYSHTHDVVRTYIVNRRRNNADWESILFEDNEAYTLDQFLDIKKMSGDFPNDVTKETFIQIVEEQKEEEQEAESIKVADEHTVMLSNTEENDVRVPTHPDSSWQLYKAKLQRNGFTDESIYNLEQSTLQILRKLNRNTSGMEPKKGLMVGHVQSGKTASMAALMAMAADWGWNYFVVLSGMIENLRSQTETRLWGDLNNGGNLNWKIIKNPSKQSENGQRLQDLHFKESSERYLTVALKNKGRLEGLNQWLAEDENKIKDLNMIIIDDEADQASINTKNVNSSERATINRLVVDLVEGTNRGTQPRSTNFISYTATPYSNFLNESTPESLYPSHFIGALPTAKEYFGPKEIFGLEEEGYDGMNIVRTIGDDEVDEVKEMQEGKKTNLPVSLKRSLAWFICSTASMRHPSINYKKPVSMLIHTSQLQAHHDEMANQIGSWFKNQSTKEIVTFCRKVYEEETAAFTPDDLKRSVPKYPKDASQLNDYPPFDEIKEEVTALIEHEVSHIMMGEEGDLQYHEGMHLCIDNCSKNGIIDDFHIRLSYPDPKDKNYPEKTPAFIIIGGSTLSRGLTIEGLVSTYFLRGPNASDTLMQMGRWFGYRKGYEVFPRVWMTGETQDKFSFLSNLEWELRRELEDFKASGKKPSEYGPRVKNSPKVSWLRITSANRMQSAQAVDLDFSGTSNQLIHYHKDPQILEHNLEVTEDFLKQCPEPYKSVFGTSIVFEQVDFNLIRDYLLKRMTFHERSTVFNHIDQFCEWFEKAEDEMKFKPWNVVVSGAGKVDVNDNSNWNIHGYHVGKVNRSAKRKDGDDEIREKMDHVNIGVLRAPGDLIADIPQDSIKEFKAEDKSLKDIGIKNISSLREKYGLDATPQLLIYRINKKSSPASEKHRAPLDLEVDPIGICLFVPGDRKKGAKAKALQIKIDPEQFYEPEE